MSFDRDEDSGPGGPGADLLAEAQASAPSRNDSPAAVGEGLLGAVSCAKAPGLAGIRTSGELELVFEEAMATAPSGESIVQRPRQTAGSVRLDHPKVRAGILGAVPATE